MCKPILMIFIVTFLALMQWGCFGVLVYYPGECKNETPTIIARDFKGWREKPPPSSIYTKADFLKSWGKPDMINSTSENTETWIYKRRLWCGVIPSYFIAVPLMLPVCDGFERIDFEGDYANRLDIRRTLMKGTLLTLRGGVFWTRDPACRHSLPDNDADHDTTKPATQASP